MRNRALFDCSLRSLRIALGSCLLRRHSQTIKRVRSLLLSTAARAIRCLIARSARSDVRWVAAVFVDKINIQRVSRHISAMSTETSIVDFFASVKITPLTGGTSP